MNLSQSLHVLFQDGKFGLALIAIAADFLLGVLVAFRKGTFRLSYVAAFARDDVAGKLAPWAVVYIAATLAPHENVWFLDLGDAAGAAYATIMLAWAGSIFSSLRELGVPIRSRTLAAPEGGAG